MVMVAEGKSLVATPIILVAIFMVTLAQRMVTVARGMVTVFFPATTSFWSMNLSNQQHAFSYLLIATVARHILLVAIFMVTLAQRMVMVARGMVTCFLITQAGPRMQPSSCVGVLMPENES